MMCVELAGISTCGCNFHCLIEICTGLKLLTCAGLSGYFLNLRANFLIRWVISISSFMVIDARLNLQQHSSSIIITCNCHWFTPLILTIQVFSSWQRTTIAAASLQYYYLLLIWFLCTIRLAWANFIPWT